MNKRVHNRRSWVYRLAALFFILSLHLPTTAHAQTGSIRFDTLSVEAGLSQSSVRAILQDSRGFLWFGTDDGLNKYDGYTFTIYKNDPDNPETLSDNSILAIYEDSLSNLWVGTGRGLDRFDRQREIFKHSQNNPNDPLSLKGSAVSAITEDQQGNLWVGTVDGGLNLLDRSDGAFTHYQNYPNDPGSLGSNLITSLAADTDGGLWIGGASGLDYYDNLTQRFFHFRHNANNPNSLSSNTILALLLDRQGVLWIGTEDGGLNRYNRLDRTFRTYTDQRTPSNRLNSRLVRAIFEDQQGRLWLGGDNGLSLLNREKNSFTSYQHDPNDPHSLSSQEVYAIHEDRSGVLWIGTNGGGLSKYIQTNERFALYQHRVGGAVSLSDDIVYAVFEDRQGDVWVGTMDGGLNQIDRQQDTVTVYQNNPSDSSSLSNNDVRAIYEDQEGSLWVGTYGGGLNRYDRATRRFTHFQYNPQDPESLSDDRVMVVYEDQRRNLWVGTRGGGLDLMIDRQKGRFVHYRNNPRDPASLSDDFVHALLQDKSGKLWVGTNAGVNVLDLDTKRFRRYKNQADEASSLSNDRVLSFYESADGVMWVGTLLGGLNRFNRSTQSFTHYREKQGLPNDVVYGILGDAQGSLWLSTNMGLSHFDPRDESFHNYDIRDGLQSNEFNAGASYQHNMNRLYFGGMQGLTIFNPDEISDNPITPPVVITAFKKFNQVERTDLENNEEIVLSYQDNFISFEFAALDFSTPEKNQYAYMLEGFNKTWVYSGTQRYASYTNLKGGEYVFRVKGSNKDGVWNESGTAVKIVVVPPLWERWWFVGSLTLGLVGGAAGIYLLRIGRIQSEQRFLEEQVRERTQEIERRRLVAEGLREILAILNSNRTLRESLEWIIQQAVRLTGARAVVIFRGSHEGLPVAVASNLPPPGSTQLARPQLAPDARGLSRLGPGEENLPTRRSTVMYLPEWISKRLMSGHPVIVADLAYYRRTHPEISEHRLEQFGALLAVPLWLNDVVDGGLVLVYDRGYTFNNDDLQTAQNFADHAALAIANARLRVQAEEQAVTAERSRLARDLHDAVTQTLFATSLIAEVLPRIWQRNPAMGQQKLAEIRELTRGALAEMRTLLMELRPAALDDVDLADLLQQLSEAFTGRARVPVALHADKGIALPPTVKTGYYRIAQEALNNVSKHARASQVTVELVCTAQGIEMTISDNGCGFSPGSSSPDHFGLGIMEERAQVIGARYTIESQVGAGTCIRVSSKNA